MISLIVNPEAGGGRAGAAIPRVQHELERRGIAHTVHETQSLCHARELAQSAGSAGQTAVALGGDGLVSAVAAALRGSEGVLGVLPAGRGNDFARFLGIPLDPVAACEVLRHGHVQPARSWLRGRPTLPRRRQLRLGLRRQPDRQPDTADPRPPRLRLRRAPRADEVEACELPPAARRRTVDDPRIHGRRREFRRRTAAGWIAPDASSTDGLFDVVLISDVPGFASCAICPRFSSGTRTSLRSFRIVRARDVEVDADQALHRLRRRRPDRRVAGRG